MKQIKKLLALLLCLGMAWSAVSVCATSGVTIQAELELDVECTAQLPYSGIAYFEFTPEEDGTYDFYSISSADTYGYLYDENMSILTSDDDSGDSDNFCITYSLTAGERYIYGAGFFSNSVIGSFPVIIKKAFSISSITFNPVSIIENSNGHLSTDNNGNEYFYYYWWNSLSYTVTMGNGDTVGGSGTSFYYNDTWYNFDYNDTQSSNPWTVGNSYTISLSINGASYNVSVSIIESPIESIVFKPISIIEKSNGWFNNEYNPDTDKYDLEYFYYSWEDFLEYTITFTDGSSIEKSGTSFYYNGQYYSLTCSDIQEEEHWYVGNTYRPTVSVMGYETTVSVSITESPIESIVFKPISIPEKSLGYITESYNGEYFYYEWYDLLDYTVNYKDGSAFEGTGTESIYYNGQYYFLNTNDNQSEEHWEVGNTYTAEVFALGYKSEVEISITEISIQAEMKEDTQYSVELDSAEVAYFAFTPDRSGSYAFTSISDWDTYGVLYDENLNELACDDDNGLNSNFSVEYRLTAGTRYIYRASFLSSDRSGSFNVKIYSLPTIKSITVEPLSIIANSLGYNNYEYDSDTGEENSWFYYIWYNAFSFTVLFDDETTYSGTGNSINYKGNVYYLSCFDNQYDEHWEEGNTYYPTISLYDYETTVPITIARTSIESIDVEPIILNVSDYYTESYYDDKTCTWTDFNCYRWENALNYTVHFIDGTTATGNANSGIYYNGSNYYPNLTDSQTPKNAWTEGTYTESMTLMNYTVNISVTVAAPKTENGFEYVATNGMAYIMGCTLTDDVIRVPSTIGGATVVGITSLGEAIKTVNELIIPDSVTTVDEDLISNGYELTKITIGSGLSNLNCSRFFYRADDLEEITVSQNNPSYTSVDGILYNKDVTTLLVYPAARKGVYNIPETVTDIEAIIYDLYYMPDVKLVFPRNNNTGYVKVDGIIYTDDMKVVIDCDYDREGVYEMPNTVTELGITSLAKTLLTKVTVSEGVTSIVYYAFGDSVKLESITLPDTLESIESKAFYNTGLTDIVIPESVTDIKGDAFDGTPLYNNAADGAVYIDKCFYGYKGDMPENTEIVIKEGTTVMASYALSEQTNLKKLTIPASLHSICYGALNDCYNIESIVIAEGNEYFYMENGILYDIYGNSIWAPMTEIRFSYYSDEVQYGYELSSYDFGARRYYADGDFSYIPTQLVDVRGYNPYYVGTQAVTVSCEGYSETFYIDVIQQENIMDPGDLNLDGMIDAYDLMNLRQILVMFDASAEDNPACDANDDGAIDIRDIVCIKKQLVAKDDIIQEEFPESNPVTG